MADRLLAYGGRVDRLERQRDLDELFLRSGHSASFVGGGSVEEFIVGRHRGGPPLVQ